MISQTAVDHWNRIRATPLSGRAPVPVPIAVHPLMVPVSKVGTQTMGFFPLIIGAIGAFVAGLAAMLATIITLIAQTIMAIIGLIISLIGAAFGVVSWSQVMSSLGGVISAIQALIVGANPLKLIHTFLLSNPITSYPFNLLDKFVGGMLTYTVNISDVVLRTMTGQFVGRDELIKTGLQGIRVAGRLIGGYGGRIVGLQVCKDAGAAKDLCQAAFTIVGAAAGGYLTDVATEGVFDTSKGFYDRITESGAKYVENRLVQEASRAAIRICQQQQWAGKKECSILGQIAADYIKAPEGTEWTDFLADEIAKYGVQALMMQWFPPQTPEGQAIRRRIIIMPGQQIVEQPYSLEVPQLTGQSKGGAALLVAAAAAGVLLIGSSV